MTDPGAGRRPRVDAIHAQGVQVGERNHQVNYVTQVLGGRTTRPPRITVHGEIESPYKGLSAFGEDDAAFFFGRDPAINDILHRIGDRLAARVPLLVSGASGAGKSSLLHAGVLPRLAAAGLPGLPGARLWPKATLTPARAPMAELAAAVAPLAGIDAATLRRSLEADPRGMADIAYSFTSKLPGTQGRLVLVIDQLEEIFTQCEEQPERDGFIAALHAAASEGRGPEQAPPALVVLSGRADFETRFAEHEKLADTVQSRYLLTPMSGRQLRLAITGPAQVANATVAPELADELVRAAHGSGSAVLPHVSHALDQAWRYRADDDVLGLDDYDRVGGLEDSIRASADLAFASLTQAQQTVARPVFMRMVTVSSDLAASAGRASRTELTEGQQSSADVDAVIEAFAAERLLTVDESSVEISHEVMLTEWTTLQSWLDGDRIDLAQYSRLTADADDWDTRDRPASYLYSPSRMDEIDAAARRWAAAPGRYPALGKAAQAFLGAARRAARRARARRRAVIMGLSLLTVAALAAAGLAVNYASDATRQNRIANSRALAGQALNIEQSDPLGADQLAAAAWKDSPTTQAASAMSSLLAQQEHMGEMPAAPSGSDMSVALSPDGTFLAGVNDASPDLRIWNTGSGKSRALPLGPGSGELDTGVAFSPDGRVVASLSSPTGIDGSYIRLWNPAAGTLVRAITVRDTQFNFIAFGEGGRILVATDGSSLYRWNVATGQQIGSPAETGETGADDMAVSPGGRLAALAVDGRIGIWNLATGRVAVRPWEADTGLFTNGMAFSPDGRLIAAADDSGNVRFWNASTGKPAGKPISVSKDVLTDSVSGVAFSPDGRTLAVVDSTGRIGLWDPATGQRTGVLTEASPNSATAAPGNLLAFSTRTGMLASADGNGTIQMWNLPARQPVGAPLGTSGSWVRFSQQPSLLTAAADGYLSRTNHVGPASSWPAGSGAVKSASGHVVAWPLGSQVELMISARNRFVTTGAGTLNTPTTIALNPGGSLLATADTPSNTIRLWRTSTGKSAGPPVHAGDQVIGMMTFSPDGRMLAVGYGDGTIQLLNAGTGSLARGQAPLKVGKNDAVNGLAFSPAGSALAAATENGIVMEWDPVTGRRLATLNPRRSVGDNGARSVAFSPDGKVLAVGYSDGTIQLWNQATKLKIGGPMPTTDVQGGTGAPIANLEFSPDGSLLLSANSSSAVAAWETRQYTNPYAALCGQVGAPDESTWHQYDTDLPEPSGLCSGLPAARVSRSNSARSG